MTRCEQTSRSMTAAFLSLPGSALVVGVVLAGVSWVSLPPQVPIHWGVGGADLWVSRPWAVGVALGMSAAATLCATGYAVTARHQPRAVFDAAALAGLFSWVGLAALSSGIWPQLAGNFTLLGLVIPVVLAYLLYRRAFLKARNSA